MLLKKKGSLLKSYPSALTQIQFCQPKKSERCVDFNPEPVTLLKRGEECDPNYDVESAKERSRETWAKLERYEREFEERQKALV